MDVSASDREPAADASAVTQAPIAAPHEAPACPVDDSTRDAILAALDRARAEHGFRSATVYVYDTPSTSLHAVVATGPQATFIAHMHPLAYNADSEVAEVLRRGRACFIEDTHDVVTDGEPAEGVARWRAGVETGSHATLPLADHLGLLGVVTLEWGESRGFCRADRDALYRAARDVVRSIRRESSARVATRSRSDIVVHEEPGMCETPEAAPSVAIERVMVATDDGALVDEELAADRAWLASIAALEAPASHAAPRSGALLDMHRLPSGDIALAVGSLPLGPTAEDAARLVGHALRVHGLFAEDAADLLGRVRETLAAGCSDDGVTLLVALYNCESGLIETAGDPDIAYVLARREGGARALPAGASALMLVGDHAILAAGCPAGGMEGAGCSAAVAAALDGLGRLRGARIPQELLDGPHSAGADLDRDVAIACVTRYAGAAQDAEADLPA